MTTVIFICLIFTGFMIYALVAPQKSDYDQKLDDQLQMEALAKMRKKKKAKKTK